MNENHNKDFKKDKPSVSVGYFAVGSDKIPWTDAIKKKYINNQNINNQLKNNNKNTSKNIDHVQPNKLTGLFAYVWCFSFVFFIFVMFWCYL